MTNTPKLSVPLYFNKCSDSVGCSTLVVGPAVMCSYHARKRELEHPSRGKQLAEAVRWTHEHYEGQP